jgi:hypothetical protein
MRNQFFIVYSKEHTIKNVLSIFLQKYTKSIFLIKIFKRGVKILVKAKSQIFFL